VGKERNRTFDHLECQGPRNPAGQQPGQWSAEDLSRLIHGLEARQTAMEMRNQELRRAQAVDCEDVLARVIADLRLAVRKSKAVITHDPLPTVYGDSAQLGQLFQNLISNAVKFRRDEPPRVHISATEEDGQWHFSVQDNGIGIEQQHAERIFVMFQRLQPRTKFPGTGIGLAVSKKNVERHNGRIWVVSEPGKGSTFWFTIGPGGDGGTEIYPHF
jgi:light-regulated signal transduction histidine kinase (bacteriophytochrome)